MDSNSISSCGDTVSDNKIIKNNQLGFYHILFKDLVTELIFYYIPEKLYRNESTVKMEIRVSNFSCK